MRGSWTPWIAITVDYGEARVGDGEGAVFVDRFDVGGRGDVEGGYADYGVPG